MNDLFEENIELEEDTLKGKYLTFLIGKDTFGIEIRYVSEIIGMQPITEVPEAPEYAKGVINLRGKIIPVINLRKRFGREVIEYTDRTCIIIVSTHDMLVGLIVDGVDEVISIPDEEIVPPPELKKGVKNRYIYGIGKVNGSVKLLLDCDKILSDEEFEQLGQEIQQ